MTNIDVLSSCILIVDDEPRVVELLEGILGSGGYRNVVSTNDPRCAEALFQESNPDLVILDLHMPHMSGVVLLQEITIASTGNYLPIVVLTADVTPEAKLQVLEMGAKDFLLKPFDTTEVLLRIKNLLETRWLYKELRRHNETLEQRVSERTRQLTEAQAEILSHLAVVSEYQDDDTSQHTQRVGALAALVARALGQSEEEIEFLRLAAPLHDIGKVGVPNHILCRSEKLMPSEFEIMKSHTTVGAEILAKSKFRLLQLARQIALYHHEHWDGLGYPQRLRGEHIPLAARIVSVVDAFDAMTHGRSYKKPLSIQAARVEIRAQAGQQFDPRVVDAFLNGVTSQALQEIVNDAQPNPEIADRALAIVSDASELRSDEETGSVAALASAEPSN